MHGQQLLFVDFFVPILILLVPCTDLKLEMHYYLAKRVQVSLRKQMNGFFLAHFRCVKVIETGAEDPRLVASDCLDEIRELESHLILFV